MLKALRNIVRSPAAFLGVGLRLSVVVAIATAGLVYFDLSKRHSQQLSTYYELKGGYECGARIDRERLETAATAVGTYDVGKLGCANRPFIVSAWELADVRAGKLVYPRPEVNWGDWFREIWQIAAIFAVLTNLVALGLVGLWYVGRWVIGAK